MEMGAAGTGEGRGTIGKGVGAGRGVDAGVERGVGAGVANDGLKGGGVDVGRGVGTGVDAGVTRGVGTGVGRGGAGVGVWDGGGGWCISPRALRKSSRFCASLICATAVLNTAPTTRARQAILPARNCLGFPQITYSTLRIFSVGIKVFFTVRILYSPAGASRVRGPRRRGITVGGAQRNRRIEPSSYTALQGLNCTTTLEFSPCRAGVFGVAFRRFHSRWSFHRRLFPAVRGPLTHFAPPGHLISSTPNPPSKLPYVTPAATERPFL